MKKFKLRLSEDYFQRLKTDMKCQEERLIMHMKINGNATDALLREKKPRKEDIDYWIGVLEEDKKKAECWKVLPDKIKNNSEIVLTDYEFSKFIECLADEIELGKDRLNDYVSGMFSWGHKLVEFETESIQMRRDLYKELVGKDYKDETYED
jgi:hypothetical protein